MFVYHGTSYENYESILENGFKTGQANWIVSEPNTVYFYAAENFVDKHGKVSKEVYENAKIEARDAAAENAIITAAIQGSMAHCVAVLEFEEDDEVFEEDTSCGNSMVNTAVCTTASEANEMLQYNRGTVYFYNYDPFMRYAVLAGLFNSEYLNSGDLTGSQIANIQKIAEAVEGDIFPEIILDCYMRIQK